MITKKEAMELLKEYNTDEFLLEHAKTVSFVMEYFAKELGFEDEAEFWGIVGLLHDLDFQMYPDEHCIKTEEILREKGIDERIIKATCSHAYGVTETPHKPEHMMEKVLFAIDELTGLIGACALVRPSKSTKDLEVKSLKKKFKQPSFAAAISRELITRGAEMLDWEMDDLFQRTILAMRAYEDYKENNG